jgi:hypothetical protein
MTRIVCQCGLIFVQSFALVPALTSALGHRTLDASSLTIFHLQNVIVHEDRRELLMPSLLNAGKLGSDFRLRLRRLMVAMIVVVLVATCVSYFTSIQMYYEHGASGIGSYQTRVMPTNALNTLTTSLRQRMQEAPSPLAWRHIIAGAAVVAGLSVLRQTFYWWPLHPVGLLTAPTYPMTNFWFSIFLGWFWKYLTQSFGGGRAVRRMRDVAMGLILGEAIIAAVWLIVGLCLGRQVLNVLPG